MFNFIVFICGIILAFAMPGFGIAPLAWIGLIPIFFFIDKAKGFKQAFFYGYIFALGFNLLTLNWFLGLHPMQWMGMSHDLSVISAVMIWLFAVLYTSLFFGLFTVCAKFIQSKDVHIIVKSLLIAVFSVLILNKFSSIGFLAFPWGMIEYSQYQNLPLLQFVPYIKGFGLGGVLVFFNAISAFLIMMMHKKQRVKIASYGLLAVLSSVLLIHLSGLVLLMGCNKEVANLNATIVQSNITIEDEKQALLKLSCLKKYFLTQINKAPKGLVVIPEAAIMDFIRKWDKKYVNKLAGIAKEQDKTLVIGTIDKKNFNGNPFVTNSALILDRNLEYTYDKVYIVPFGEYVPFYKNMPTFARKIVDDLNIINFSAGSGAKVFKTKSGNIAPSICYDAIFSNLINAASEKKVDVLVNLSNLAWFHNTSIKDQFLANCVFRAAEVRKPLVLAINTGNSAFISPSGKILYKLPGNIFTTASYKY